MIALLLAGILQCSAPSALPPASGQARRLLQCSAPSALRPASGQARRLLQCSAPSALRPASGQARRLLLAQQTPPPADSQAANDAMNQARRTFEYGDYAQASKLLSALVQAGRFESVQLRAEAYRLLGLSLFYQGRKGEAHGAFLEYLYIEPDAELDPFYVPPAAVQFFDQVKKEAEPRLAPIRAQMRAEQEAQKKIAAEEAEKRRQRELEEERKRLQAISPGVERRVVQHEFWVTMMPFGIGQLQNGDRNLGIALATGQLISGAASAGSALLIEQLRDNATGKFDDRGPGSTPYKSAQRLNVVKWVGAAVFYALWAGGAIHAALNYKGEEVLPDRVLQPGQAP